MLLARILARGERRPHHLVELHCSLPRVAMGRGSGGRERRRWGRCPRFRWAGGRPPAPGPPAAGPAARSRSSATHTEVLHPRRSPRARRAATCAAADESPRATAHTAGWPSPRTPIRRTTPGRGAGPRAPGAGGARPRPGGAPKGGLPVARAHLHKDPGRYLAALEWQLLQYGLPAWGILQPFTRCRRQQPAGKLEASATMGGAIAGAEHVVRSSAAGAVDWRGGERPNP